MPASSCKPNLSTQVLSLLKNHGPVTIDLLHRMTEPPAPKNNLRQSLGILKKKGLVDTVYLNPQTTFYQVSQALQSRKEIADILDTNASEIVQPLLRKQDWIHNQWCEYWIHFISRLFPEAQIVREHTIGSNEIAKRILQINSRDLDLLPDFLLIFPKSEHSDATYIAFEIERTRKSDKRLLKKFKKYINGTKIDGLIYICDSGRLSETIRMLYHKKLVEHSQRIGHYGDHFFLFSDSMTGGGEKLNRLLNAKGELVQFTEWCNHLRKTKWTLRRDNQFI